MFKTKEVIAEDRARFARAWYRYFGDFGKGEGDDTEKAFKVWFEMVEGRYKKHKKLMRLERHPKYIINKITNLNESQFGHNAFGLRDKYHNGVIDNFKKINL